MKNSIVKYSNVESSSCSPVAAPKKKIRQSAGSTEIENVAMHFPLQCIFVKFAYCCAGGPSSSCEMIILRNNGHGGIIRVCMGIFTTALRNKKKFVKFSKKNTPPYFHSVLLGICPLTWMKRTHFSELSISRFSTYITWEKPKAKHSISERPIREA